MSITGLPGQGPVRVGIAINDTSAGILLANGITLALLARERTGEGQWVHTSLLEAQIFMLDFQASRYTMKGEVAKQEGNFPPDLARHRHVPDRRRLYQHRRLGRRSVEAVLRGRRRQGTRNRTGLRHGPLRAKNREALIAHLNDLVRSKPSAYWVETLNKAGVPCGPINTIDQVFADPQVQHLGIRRPVDHPKLGTYDIVGQPIHMSAYPQPERLRPTPDQASTPTGVARARLRRRRDHRIAPEARRVGARNRSSFREGRNSAQQLRRCPGPRLRGSDKVVWNETIQPDAVSDCIREQAERYPERVAAVDMAGQATYRELAARAGRVAAALQARGIGCGSRVGLLINNRREFLEAAFGGAALGAVVVPFSTWSKENELPISSPIPKSRCCSRSRFRRPGFHRFPRFAAAR